MELKLTEWSGNTTFRSAKHLINSLQIVNNTAERGVQIIEEFNDKFTKNEKSETIFITSNKVLS